MIDKKFATDFAADWIESWNRHDLDRILSHYTDDFEMISPAITAITGELTGKLKGREVVSSYWEKALQFYPDLHFELITTLIGVDSVTIYYKGVRGLSAEVFHFDENGKVAKALAHYA